MSKEKDGLTIECDRDDPQVTINVNGKDFNCLLDSGATYSALVEAPPEVDEATQQAEIVGIEGKTETRPFLETCHINLEGQFGVEHSCLYTPKCPVNLLGRDLLCKMHARVDFSPERIRMTVPIQQMFLFGERIMGVSATSKLPDEIVIHVDAQVWDTEHPKKVIPLIPVEIRVSY